MTEKEVRHALERSVLIYNEWLRYFERAKSLTDEEKEEMANLRQMWFDQVVVWDQRCTRFLEETGHGRQSEHVHPDVQGVG